jgi:hypothetical protein
LGGTGRHYTTCIVQGLKSKKLNEAGYHYGTAGSSQSNKESLENSAASWGITLDDAALEDEDEDFTVFYDATLALEVFFAVQTQWNYSMDGLTGLNYSSVIAVIALYSKKRDRLTLLHEVAEVERGFLRAINEKKTK